MGLAMEAREGSEWFPRTPGPREASLGRDTYTPVGRVWARRGQKKRIFGLRPPPLGDSVYLETRAPGSQQTSQRNSHRFHRGLGCGQDDYLALKGPCFLSESHRNNDSPDIPTPPHFLFAAKGWVLGNGYQRSVRWDHNSEMAS